MLNAYDVTGKSMPPAQLLAAYTRGPADLEAALAGLTPDQLLRSAPHRPPTSASGARCKSFATLPIASNSLPTA